MPRKIKLEHLEQEFERITKLGYAVVATADQCLIWKGDDLIIDSDFHNDYYENAVGAIGAFWDEEVETVKTTTTLTSKNYDPNPARTTPGEG